MKGGNLKSDPVEGLEDLELTVTGKVLVYGAGAVACMAALELAGMGHDVLLGGPDAGIEGAGQHLWGDGEEFSRLMETLVSGVEKDSRIETMTPMEIIDFGGPAGRFSLRIMTKDRDLSEEVGAVIFAEEPLLIAHLEAWGLEASEKARPLSWLESAQASLSEPSPLPGEDPMTVVFLSGFTHQANPFSQKRAVEAATRLAADRKNQIFFITEHFKVAHSGMERLTRNAREAGVLFVKLTDRRPEIRTDKDRVDVRFFDETLDEEVSLFPDLVILEEQYGTPKGCAGYGQRFGFSLDPDQRETIYNRPIYTPSKGIWLTGPGKGAASLEEGIGEARAAALEVHCFLGTQGVVSAKRRLLFDNNRCGRCLTCYRLCPHRAISFPEGSPVFFDLSCKACGICAAGCPADAIQIAGFRDEDMEAGIIHGLKDRQGVPSIKVVAFCCENSAFEAARLAAFRGLEVPEGLHLIRVPCAGRVDLDHLLKAFELGADGVMVLGCHDESCRSMKGNGLAERRAGMVRGLLEELGLETNRLFFGTLASSMGFEFAGMARDMDAALRELGPKAVR